MSAQAKNQNYGGGLTEIPRPLVAVMSSGFFGFFAHAGFLQGLADLGIEPDAYAGCSSGALAAAFAAAGMPPLEMLEVFSLLRKEDFWDPPPKGRLIKACLNGFRGVGGYLQGQAMERLLESILPASRFEDCPKPCLMVSLDIANNERVVHTQGGLARAVRASGAVPVMFAPAPWRDRCLVDGGLVDKAPLLACRTHLAPRAMAVHFLPSASLEKPYLSVLKNAWAPFRLQRRSVDAARQAAYQDQRTLVEKQGIWLQEVRQEAMIRLSPQALDRGPRAFSQAREVTNGTARKWLER